MAINGAAFDGFENVAEQSARGARLEDDRDALRLHFHRAEPAHAHAPPRYGRRFRVFEAVIVARDGDTSNRAPCAVLRRDRHGAKREQ